MQEFGIFHLFSGLGGGALGFQRAEADYLGMRAQFRTLGGVDSDPDACRDFETLTGVAVTCMDLFARDDYIAFHGAEPPDGWHEAMPEDLRLAAGGIRPDVVFTSPPCLPGKAEIITQEGPRAIETIRAGSRVLTHQGRYRDVLKVGTHLHQGQMIRIRLNGSVEFQEFTPNHPIWRRKVIQNKGTRQKRMLGLADFVEASQISVGDRIGFPVDSEIPGTAHDFVDSLGNPRVVHKGGHNEGARYAKPPHDAVDTRIVDLRPYAKHPGLWFLMGAYLGDGYRRRDAYEVNFCIGSNDGEVASRVRSALDELGINWYEDTSSGRGNIKIRALGRHLWTICGELGDGAENKRVPERLMHLEQSLLESLIAGYRATDGHERGRHVAGRVTLQAAWHLTSISLGLLKDFQRLLLRTGVFGFINHNWPGGPQTIMGGRTVQTRPRYTLSVRIDPIKRTVFEFDGGAVWIRARTVEIRQADEMVWNLEVAEDNTFCVHLMATHNCKGFSALLPQASAASDKYQALNRLTVRGIALALAAWGDDLPGLIILENVPRITSRGIGLLTQIKTLLTSAGYRLDDTTHDLGEVGGLSQHRRRYLLVARHPAKVPAPLYVPPKRKVKAIGDALGRLPLPDAPEAGPLHRLPRLQWLTWIRLALIPAGGDWRDLQAIIPESVRIVPQGGDESWALTDPRIPGDNDARHSNIYRVTSWDEAFGTVTSGKDAAICDPRLAHVPREGSYRVSVWTEPGSTVTGQAGVGTSNGMQAVADPRPPQRANRRSGQYAVCGWDDPCGTVTGEDTIGSGAPSIADPRLTDRASRHPSVYKIQQWENAADTVTGTRFGSGALAVGDPRLTTEHGKNFAGSPGLYGVMDWEQPAGAVTGSAAVSSSNSPAAVADPRLPDARDAGTWVIIAADNTWHRPLTTLELAVLQGLPARLDADTPLTLAGKSQAKWRERIGNAVPVGAAEAVGRTMLTTLIAGRANTLMLNLYATAVWVRNWSRKVWTRV